MSVKRIIIVLLVLLVMAAFCTIYYFTDPEKSVLMPKCMLYVLTGVKCPICGVQRFVHHFLNGEILTALSYNYALVLFLPYILLSVVSEIGYQTKRFHNVSVRLFDKLYSAKVVKMYVVIFILWGIIRNIFGL